MANSKLSDSFIDELIAISLVNIEVFLVCKKYVLYSYFPHGEYKKIWKFICDNYTLNQKTPTIGVISQTFSTDEIIISILADVKKVKVSSKQEFLLALETFILDSMFIDHYETMGDLYNSGNKIKALQISKKFAEDINNFSLRKEDYELVFKGFEKRHEKRIDEHQLQELNTNHTHAIFGIDGLDQVSRGGIRCDVGDMCMFLAQAKVGKSTLARHIDIANARRGMKVFHVQLEGAKQECIDELDKSWTGLSSQEIEYGGISEDKILKLKKTIRDIGNGEIVVEAFDKMGNVECSEIENSFFEVEKIHGKMSLIVIDYMELLQPSNGIRYKISEERFRREAIVQWMKNFAVKNKCALVTFTQGSDVSPDLLNDPKYKMTRHNVSECKGIAKPFTFFISLNRTNDEYDNNTMRLYGDAFRKSKGNVLIQICTDYDNHRFYDRKRTLAEMYTIS